MRSPTFNDLRETLEDFAEREGIDPIEALNQLTEYYIPGIEELGTCLVPLEFDEIH